MGFVFRNKSQLSLSELLDLMFNMRGDNPAKVRDIVDVRKMLMFELQDLQTLLRRCHNIPEDRASLRASNVRRSLKSMQYSTDFPPSDPPALNVPQDAGRSA